MPPPEFSNAGLSLCLGFLIAKVMSRLWSGVETWQTKRSEYVAIQRGFDSKTM